MRSPKDMKIIEIDITNACVHSCSNCTRFCGHHSKPYFMTLETFRRAVDSLLDFGKTIGIMGGEPTVHPQFEQFVRYIDQKYPTPLKLKTTRKPLHNFVNYIRDKNYYYSEALNKRKGFVLLTSLTRKYYEYYELIQDTFNYQLVNDHQNPSLHQPLLVSRKELGIPDDQWIHLRDKCWVQNMWSASITPKGAFFCEVAGALDMLFDGPGGWPIEPGWWKREPQDFGYQLEWCEICGGALLNCGRLSNEETDDVSPQMYERLKELGSPKVRNGKVNILDMKSPRIEGGEMPDTRDRYLTDYQKRISKTNTALNPKSIDAVLLDDAKTDLVLLKSKIANFINIFDSVTLAAMDEIALKSLQNLNIETSRIKVIPPVLVQWGRTINKAIAKTQGGDWIWLLDASAEVPADICMRLKQMVLNPGVLYSFAIPGLEGKAVLFNPLASALKNAGFDRIGRCTSMADFANLWDIDKRITLSDDFDAFRNPDYDDWHRFADNYDLPDKTELYRCLDKIRDDELKSLNQGRTG